MSKEQEFFLSVISDHINGKRTIREDNLNWELVFNFFTRHQLQGFFYTQCKWFMEKDPDLTELYTKIQSAALGAVYRYYSLKKVLASVQRKLSEDGIPSFVIKGFEIAKYYPCPELRSMGDIDLVVHESDMSRSHESLIKQGFNNKSKGNHEWVYIKQGTAVIELHDKLLYEHVINKDEYVSFFDNVWQHVEINDNTYKLDWNYHYIYMLIHLRKHLLYSGVGFRQFIDLALVTKNNQDLDWVWISEQLEKLQLFEFAKLCIGFCRKWFNLDLPFQSIEPDTGFYQEVTEKIFANGVFGFDNPENISNVLMTEIHDTKKPLLVMIRRLIWLVYPDYKSMSYSKDYSFVRGRPYLLPFAWVLRHYHILIGKKKKKVGYKLKSSIASFEEIKRRDKYFEEWRL